MKLSWLYISFFLSFILFGCFKDTCVEKAGPVITTTKNISSIDSILLNDNISLTLTQGAENKISIECGENIQPNISTSVEGKTLIIKNNVKCKWLRNPEEKILVHVEFIKLNYLHYSGYGDIKSTNTITTSDFVFEVGNGAGMVLLNINANNTTISNNGSADVTLKGNTNNCYAYTGFRGTFNFKAFEVKNYQIDFGSVFNGYINVTESLKGTIRHTGNLYYSGNPSTIDITVMNIGKLIHL